MTRADVRGGTESGTSPDAGQAARDGRSRRRAVAGLLLVACLASAIGTVVFVARRAASSAATDFARPPAAGAPPSSGLLFRSTALDDDYGHVALVSMDAPGDRGRPGAGEAAAGGSARGSRTVTPVTCDRVAADGGRAICLTRSEAFGSPAVAVVMDEDLEPVTQIGLSGVPSRTRLSPDGRYAATTAFVTGHSYAQGGFSTETVIFDAATGERVLELEDLEVTRNGRPFRAVDFNYWGVTFVEDSSEFNASLGSRGAVHLIHADRATGRARVVADNVECPSLSPDGTRIAYKKRVDGSGPVRWRLQVMDLSTMTPRALAETRNVDDQVLWLDDGHIAYGLPDDTSPAVTNVWRLAVDDDGGPELLAAGAWSPAVLQ